LSDEGGAERLSKPDELLALHDVTAELFATLQRWFAVGPVLELDVSDIDSAVTELGDPRMIAGMAMRKLQALRLVSTPGVLTSTDMVVAMINDLNRALLQAPGMYLSLRAEGTDWDRAWAELDVDPGGAPSDPSATDPEIDRFHQLHARLHEAMYAVMEASEGDIRLFE
jgi:hypothetical protein